MFKLIEFFQKRPSNRVIRSGQMIFGTAIALLLGLNLDTITLHLPEALKSYETGITYGLFIFAFVPFFMGATEICIAKRKYVRIIQICFGITLMVVGNSVIDIKTAPIQESVVTSQNGSLDYGAITESKTPSKPLNVGFWIALLGLFPLVAGITGKCIPSKCLKYGEVIKKIRV